MKYFLPVLFLVVFCVTQLRIIETVAKYQNKHVSKVNTTDDNASDKEEDSSEEKSMEKEFECFLTNNTGLLSKISSTQVLLNTSYYLNTALQNPFTQKDIKPPCVG